MVETIAVKVVAVIVAFIVIVLAIPKLFGRTARLRRKLRAAKQCAIRDLTDAREPRRVAGIVVASDEPLIAPLSGRACVFYETEVVRAVGLGLDPWDIEYRVAIEKRGLPFMVDDGTGSVIVDTARAELLLETDVDRWSTARDVGADAEDAFLARLGHRRRGLLFEKRLHFRESIIEVGERVAVSGVALPAPDPAPQPDAPYRQAAAESKQPVLRLSSGDPLIVTDDQKFAPPLDDE